MIPDMLFLYFFLLVSEKKDIHFYAFRWVDTVRRRGENLAGYARWSAAAGFRVEVLKSN